MKESEYLELIGNEVRNKKKLFRCICGNEKWINFYNVRSGDTKSCGCRRREEMRVKARERFTGKQPANFNDYTGKKIGMIKVVKRVADRRPHTTTYLCRCECGTEFEQEISILRVCEYKRCECGFSKHPLRKRLISINQRCNNPNAIGYKYYGGKGVKVCEEWVKFPIRFIEWGIENGWKKNMELDRIDSEGDYCPENCQWLTKSEHSKKTADYRWMKETLGL